MLLDKYKLVIFDWDGTISTSTPIARAARFVKIRYSLRDIRKKRHLYMKEVVKDTPRAEEMNQLFSILYDIYSVFSKPRLKEGAMDMIKQLKKNGKKVAVFSDSNSYRLYVETRKLKIHDKVDIVLSAATIRKFKPNPMGLLLIARKFGMKLSDCIYVGDMAVDIYTAKFAGMDSCAIANGVDPYKLLKEVKPSYLIRNMEALKKTK